MKFSIGVNVEGDSFDVCNPIGTSAKTRNTLATKALSK